MKVEAEAKIGVEVDGDGLAHLKGTLDYMQLKEERTYFPTTVRLMWGVFVYCEKGCVIFRILDLVEAVNACVHSAFENVFYLVKVY